MFSYQRPAYDICAGQKLRNGEAVVVTTAGECIRLDAKGKEEHSKSFKVPATGSAIAGIEVLPNNHILITNSKGVAEYDNTGGDPIWHARLAGPHRSSVCRTAIPWWRAAIPCRPAVVELDRNGQTVWDYKVEAGFIAWRRGDGIPEMRFRELCGLPKQFRFLCLTP